MLDAYQKQSGSVAGMSELRVSDVPLGMIWKKLARPVALAPNTTSGETAATAAAAAVNGTSESVETRLMPDPMDVAIAKNMSEGALGPSAGPEEAARHSSKAAAFARPWGVVPAFTMAGMKIRVPRAAAEAAGVTGLSGSPMDAADAADAAGGASGAEMVDLRPWFLSIDACLSSFQRASASAAGAAGVGEAKPRADVHLATLEELASAMMAESPVDFRRVIFMPSQSSIDHYRDKAARMQQASSDPAAATSGGALPAAAAPMGTVPSGSGSGAGGLFDDVEDDNEASDIFKKK